MITNSGLAKVNSTLTLVPGLNGTFDVAKSVKSFAAKGTSSARYCSDPSWNMNHFFLFVYALLALSSWIWAFGDFGVGFGVNVSRASKCRFYMK